MGQFLSNLNIRNGTDAMVPDVGFDIESKLQNDLQGTLSGGKRIKCHKTIPRRVIPDFLEHYVSLTNHWLQ